MSSVSDAEVLPSSDNFHLPDTSPVNGALDEDDVPLSSTVKAKQLKQPAAEQMQQMINRINCGSDDDRDDEPSDSLLDPNFVESSEHQPTIPRTNPKAAALSEQGALEQSAPVPAHPHNMQGLDTEEGNVMEAVSKSKIHRTKMSPDGNIKKRLPTSQKQSKKGSVTGTKAGRPRQLSIRKKEPTPNKPSTKGSVKSPNKKMAGGQVSNRTSHKSIAQNGHKSKLEDVSAVVEPRSSSLNIESRNSNSVRPKKTIVKQNRSSNKTGASRSSPARSSVKATKAKKDSPDGRAKGVGKGKKGNSSKKEDKRRRMMKNSGDAEDDAEVDEVDGNESEDEVAQEEGTQDNDTYVTHTPLKGGILGNLACSSRDCNARALLDHAVQQLGKFRVVDYAGDIDMPLRAYIVGKETSRGWGLLRAVASGVALVSEDWLSTSISEGHWADINAFRSDRFGQSPRRIDCIAGTNNILNGMRVKVECLDDSAKVRKLVQICGGRVAETRMSVVINDGRTPVDGAINVNKKWLADSIEAGVALDSDAYNILT